MLLPIDAESLVWCNHFNLAGLQERVDGPQRHEGAARQADAARRHLRLAHVDADQLTAVRFGDVLTEEAHGGDRGPGAALDDGQALAVDLLEPAAEALFLLERAIAIPFVVAEHEDVRRRQCPTFGTGR